MLTHRGQLSPADLARVQAQLDAASSVAPGANTPGSGVAPVPPNFTPQPGRPGSAPSAQPGPPPSGQLGPGSLVGDYRVLARLGAGGMGTVYRAEHVQTGAPAALKVMKRGSLGPREERFRREGEAQARADSHRNVVRVRSAGQAGDLLYLAMDLCEGGDLEQLLAREGTLAPERAREVVAALADGLTHVHEQGVLHRDLKPANVLFDAEGVPKLVDFGLARVNEAQTLTKTGALLGTPAYMAPEQVKGDNRALDERVDVHALGLILFEALTGQRPFRSDSSIGLLRAIVQDEAPLLRSLRPELPRDLERITERALAKDPAHRFASASELAHALRTGESGPRPPRARRALPLVVAFLGGLALPLTALAFALWPEPGARPPSPAEVHQRLVDLRSELQLAPETTAGLSALPPLRARLDALRELAPAPELAPLEADLRLLEGLAAAARGELVQARAAARGPGGQARLRDALSGALAALTTQSDLQPGREALARASRSGVVLEPLPGWRADAELRLASQLLTEGDGPAALLQLEQRTEVAQAQEALRRALAERALATARSTLTEIEQSLAKGTRPAREVTERLRYHLRFARRAHPAGVLSDADLERLMAIATSPRRSLNAELELETAQQRPTSYEHQVAILKRLVMTPRTPTSRRGWARRYLHVAKRVARLAPPERELDALERLGDVLANSVRYTEGYELAQRLSQRADLPDYLQVKVHYWRSNYFDQEGRWLDCIAAAEQALAIDPTFDLATSRIARAAYRLKRWEDALEASMRYLLQTNPKLTPEYSNVYQRACRRVFLASRQIAKPWAYAKAREALRRLLAEWSSPDWAGWWARLAFVTLRARDHEGAREALQTAVREMAKNRRTAPLVAEAEEILPKLGPPERGQRALRRLVNKLEKLRGGGDNMTP